MVYLPRQVWGLPLCRQEIFLALRASLRPCLPCRRGWWLAHSPQSQNAICLPMRRCLVFRNWLALHANCWYLGIRAHQPARTLLPKTFHHEWNPPQTYSLASNLLEFPVAVYLTSHSHDVNQLLISVWLRPQGRPLETALNMLSHIQIPKGKKGFQSRGFWQMWVIPSTGAH